MHIDKVPLTQGEADKFRRWLTAYCDGLEQWVAFGGSEQENKDIVENRDSILEIIRHGRLIVAAIKPENGTGAHAGKAAQRPLRPGDEVLN